MKTLSKTIVAALLITGCAAAGRAGSAASQPCQ